MAYNDLQHYLTMETKMSYSFKVNNLNRGEKYESHYNKKL